MPTYQWVSPTGHIDVDGTWNNDANAYDGNWNTYSDTAHFNGTGPTDYLILIFAAQIYIDRVRFKWLALPTDASRQVEIDIYNAATGAWDNVCYGNFDTLPMNTQVTIIIPTTLSDRVRVRGYISGSEFRLYELDVEQVVPDTPSPPAPPPPNQPEVYIKEKKETKGQPPEGTTRIRTLHRSTVIAPWVV